MDRNRKTSDLPLAQSPSGPGRPERQRQRRYFDQFESYRSPLHPVVEAFVHPKVKLIERYVELSGARRLLDVGCGNGVFTEYLQRKCSCVGVDLSWQMLRRGSALLRVQGDAMALPFDANSFDISFCANLLHHLEDTEVVLREMARVSACWVVIVEPNAANPAMRLFGLVRPPERGLLRFSRGHLRRQLEAAGLRVVFLGSTGMITQNLTPRWMIPALRPFDRVTPLGAYIVAVAQVRP